MMTIQQLKEKINNTSVIFFDLDGTLIDTECLYFRFWKAGCAYYGYEMSDEEALNMRSRDVNSAMEYLSSISNGLLDYYKVKAKRIELMNEYLLTHPIKLKEGAKELLEKLQKEGKRLYLVTANMVDKALKTLKDVGLDGYFVNVISAKDVARGKPYPDVYLKAAQVVGVKPEETIVFEDSPNGLKSSYAAGCFTVMVEDLTKHEKDMDYVHAVVSSLSELL